MKKSPSDTNYKLMIDLEQNEYLFAASTITPDGKYIVSGALSSKIILWDIESGAMLRTFQDESVVLSIAITPDSKYIITTRIGGMILWDLKSGAKIRTLSVATLFSLVITADGKQIVTGDQEGTIKLWDIQSGDEIHTFEGYSCRGIVSYYSRGERDGTGRSCWCHKVMVYREWS